MIRTILTFNTDFFFNSHFPHEPVRIVEINYDNLSKYSVAQNVGYYPRRSRYLHIKQRAKQENVKLWVLYNAKFSTDLSKAKRWGIDNKEELAEENFFAADASNISELIENLQNDKAQHWVLLLSVYRVPTLQSHLYTDNTILAVQNELTQLFALNQNNIVFIGVNTILDKVSNDKFLTTKYLSPEFQPKSMLFINGDNPSVLLNQITDELHTQDVVIKPLSEYSGIGVFRSNGRESLQQLLSNMSEAAAANEFNRLRMNLDNNNASTYWKDTQGNNPLILCQEFVSSDMMDKKKITYRAVFTAYVDENCNVSLDIECIYPKKSDDNDFKSRVHNAITINDIKTAIQNKAMGESLLLAAKDFVGRLMRYNENAMIDTLFHGSDAEFLKGWQLRFNTHYHGNYAVTIDHIQRLKSLINRLLFSWPQAFRNTYPIFKKLPLSLLTEILPITSVQKIPFKLLLPSQIINNILYPYLRFLSYRQRESLIKAGVFKGDTYLFMLIQFLIGCKAIKDFITNSQYSATNIFESEELYSDINTIKNLAINILQSNRYSLQLAVVINLFELRRNINSNYEKLLPIFKIDYVSHDALIDFFQSNDEISTAISDEKLVEIIQALFNLPYNIISKFSLTVNNLLLSDYLMLLATTLFERYRNSDPYARQFSSQQQLLSFCAHWFYNHIDSSDFSHLEWQVRSQTIDLFIAGLKIIKENADIKDTLYLFCIEYLVSHPDKFSVRKVSHYLSQVIQLQTHLPNGFNLREQLLQLVQQGAEKLRNLSEYTSDVQAMIENLIKYLSTLGKYLIVANGPFLPREVILEAAQGRIIVALDGATDKLIRMGIKPHIILGDFDSILEKEIWGINTEDIKRSKESKLTIIKKGSYNTLLVYAGDQDMTDLGKAIQFCDNFFPERNDFLDNPQCSHEFDEKREVEDEKAEVTKEKNNQLEFQQFLPAFSIDIVCAVDGRIDHSIGNVRSLRSYYKSDRALRIHTVSHTVTFAKDEEIIMIGRGNALTKQQCAVISMPEASFISQGLEWDGVSQANDSNNNGPHGYKLYPGHDSICNILKNNRATITIKGEAIIVHPGFFESQHKYEETDVEIQKSLLQEQLRELDYVLLETTVGELTQIRHIRRTLKSTLGLKIYAETDNAARKSSSIYYLSMSKETVFNLASSRQPVLLAATKDKCNKFHFFRKFLQGHSGDRMKREELDSLAKKTGYMK